MGKLNKRDQYRDLLIEQIDILEKSSQKLNYSYQKAASFIHLSEQNLSEDELETFESLCGRFARSSDLLIQKVFRLIDMVNLEEQDFSIIDRIERAEKIGIIDSALNFKNIRELRNEIAHEYRMEKYMDIFHDVMGYTPILLSGIKNSIDFINKNYKDKTEK